MRLKCTGFHEAITMIALKGDRTILLRSFGFHEVLTLWVL